MPYHHNPWLESYVLSNYLLCQIPLGFLFKAITNPQEFFHCKWSHSAGLENWQGWSCDFLCNYEVPSLTAASFTNLICKVCSVIESYFSIWLFMHFFCRFNLVQLFLQNDRSAHLRRMIVDLEVDYLLYAVWIRYYISVWLTTSSFSLCWCLLDLGS